MNRRNFLRLGTGGLIASATAAEVGMWAEFVSWLQRKPVWSIPKPAVSVQIAQYSDFINLSDMALATAFYDEAFIRNLKYGFPFAAIAERKPLPVNSGKMIQMFRYSPLAPLD